MPESADAFGAKVRAFAGEVAALLPLIHLQGATLEIEALASPDGSPRAVVELKGTDPNQTSVPLRVGNDWSAGLTLRFGCRPDSSGRYMAVTNSAMAVWSAKERNPLFRLEYQDDMRTKPACHWQVHAERGALSHVLTMGGHNRPTLLSALHIPVGGARGRPGLEDFLEFVIVEIGADASDDWKETLNRSREGWRRRQIATAVRDVPSEAVRVLMELGYSVTDPVDGPAPTRAETLRAW